MLGRVVAKDVARERSDGFLCRLPCVSACLWLHLGLTCLGIVAVTHIVGRGLLLVGIVCALSSTCVASHGQKKNNGVTVTNDGDNPGL